jgi:glycogen operon protein
MRLSGSSDLYAADGRRPFASVNFVTAHDGFTLADLAAYERKHNEANGDHNRDGSDHNDSWNCGVEGPTDDPAVLELRARQRRNLLCTLLFSVGVPMLLAGDELGHTQHGNNNAYCQDNEISWLDWDLNPEQQAFLDFVRDMVRIRRQQPVLRRRRFFHGRPIRGDAIKDLYWVRPDGREMTDADWTSGRARSIGVGLVGNRLEEVDEQGQPVQGDTLVLLLNAADAPVTYHAPKGGERTVWECLVDTSRPEERSALIEGTTSYTLAPHSLALMRVVSGAPVPR